jgi:predicted transglutaminase-like cysteine proteinase
MKKLASLIIASLVLTFSALQVQAAEGAAFANEYGKTRPPIGFVKFCATNGKECRSGPLLTSRIKMNPERWNELFRVNTKVNTSIQPATDEELYGQVEYWTYPTTAGDCEDYLLLKKRELEARGFPSSALLITVVLDERNEGHAVLTVASDTGDYILDNRRDDILLWSETNYKFLKRQTQRDPKQWVSLDNSKTIATAALGTSSGE